MSTFVLGFQVLTSHIFTWEQNVLSFVDDVVKCVFYYQTQSTPTWCLIWRRAVKWQLGAFRTSCFASLKRSFCGLQNFSLVCRQLRNMLLVRSFLSLNLLHYLHCHFAWKPQSGRFCLVLNAALHAPCLLCYLSNHFIVLSVWFCIPHAPGTYLELPVACLFLLVARYHQYTEIMQEMQFLR